MVAEKLAGRVLLVSVFGSRVKGRAGPLSDVDVAVLPASCILDEKLLLACDLAALASVAFGVPDDRVDIASLDDAPLWLLSRRWLGAWSCTAPTASSSPA